MHPNNWTWGTEVECSDTIGMDPLPGSFWGRMVASLILRPSDVPAQALFAYPSHKACLRLKLCQHLASLKEV